MRLKRLCWTAILAGLVGCAAYGPGDLRAGASEAELMQSLGPPTSRYVMPDGSTRLEFARGPYGRHTWMVDLDAAGRVARWDQVLHELNFMTILPGQTRDEVLRNIGRPGERAGMRGDGQIWSWRYPTNDCLWYQVSLDSKGIVTSAGIGPDPRCDATSGEVRR
jgi:hypothetical protein